MGFAKDLLGDPGQSLVPALQVRRESLYDFDGRRIQLLEFGGEVSFQQVVIILFRA